MIIYQDIKERAVNWLIMSSLILASAINLLFKTQFDYLFSAKNIGFNLLFVFIQALLILAWIKFRKKKAENWIGLGDLLFVFAMCLGFLFNEFIYIYLISLMGALVIYFLFFKKKTTVPLAGLMSITWMIYLLINWIR